MKIILGVTGGIAAYKAVSVLRLFTEADHQVTVIPTENSLEFVGKSTWEALSGNPVDISVFSAVDTVNHVHLGQEADLVLIVPATADFLSRSAAGMANDLLTNTLLMTKAPILMAPAMHTQMWENSATQANIQTLKSRDVHIIDPVSGRLTGVDSGIGRLAEPEDIFTYALKIAKQDPKATSLFSSGVFDGKKVLITGGRTQEPIDPVRYIANKSSGKQAVALAQAALEEGAEVNFIAAIVDSDQNEKLRQLADMYGPRIHLSSVTTAEELLEKTYQAGPQADVIFMAAAVSDYRVKNVQETKIKKTSDQKVLSAGDITLELEENPDILERLVDQRDQKNLNQKIIGFAAETGDHKQSALQYAQAKKKRKKVDYLLFNDVSQGAVLGQDTNTIIAIDDSKGFHYQFFKGSKLQVARDVLKMLSSDL